MKRRWKLLIGAVTAFCISAAAAPLWLPVVADLAEPTIRRQVLAIASNLLEPRVEVGRFSYSFPLTVDIRDLKLVSTSDEHQEIVILEAPTVGITLDRLPILGGPLVFRDFLLRDVRTRFVTEQDGRILGWSDLLSGDDDGDDGDDRPVSEIFSIDQIRVENLALEYSLVDREDKMVLEDLDFVIDSKSKSGSKSIDLGRGPGWYEVDTTIRRKGLFEVKVDGGLDIDTLVLELKSLDLELELNDDAIGHLPPQIQSFVRDRRVRGRLDGTLSGVFDLDEPRKDDSRFNLVLRPTKLAIDDYIVAIDAGSLAGKFKDEVLRIDPIRLELFGGTITATAKIADEVKRGLPPAVADAVEPSPTERTAAPDELAQARIEAVQRFSNDFVPTKAFDTALEFATGLRAFTSLDVDRLQLQSIHRVDPTEPQKIAGLLSAGVELDANLGRPLSSVGGGGEIEVVEGRFGGGPLVSALARMMRVVTLNGRAQDWLRMTFLIRDEHIEIDSLSALSGPIGVRGSGTVSFTGEADLSLNGGPLEGLQATSGRVGQLTGFITDRLAKYIVTGPLWEPRVRVAPLGIRLGR